MELKSEEGQSIMEYILLLAIVVFFVGIIFDGLRNFKLVEKVVKQPLQEHYARVYRYGNSKAKGYEDGTPELHPRIEDPRDNNFRIFINPRSTRQ
jgi:hypothetical protein